MATDYRLGSIPIRDRLGATAEGFPGGRRRGTEGVEGQWGEVPAWFRHRGRLRRMESIPQVPLESNICLQHVDKLQLRLQAIRREGVGAQVPLAEWPHLEVLFPNNEWTQRPTPASVSLSIYQKHQECSWSSSSWPFRKERWAGTWLVKVPGCIQSLII